VIVPEDIVKHVDGYAPEHWDYPHRCADIELALIVAREKVEEWDRVADPHGWWHERPRWIALHNEVLRLRKQIDEMVLNKAEQERP
jgi:hypothetical protein